MHSRFARFLVLFAALWLPLQAVAALAMPFCRHGAPQAVVQVEVAAMHCEHAAEHAPEHAPAPTPSSDKAGQVCHACDNCSYCHLAGASALPLAMSVQPEFPAVHDYALPAERTLVSYIPEQPQRPPRGALA